MGNCAIVGINWGDEGKGRMVDLLTESYDIVIRYQGGGNAGHTVINEYGKFALHLLPSGIFRKDVVNILGNGLALDPENLWKEIEEVTAKGVPITPGNLKISDRHRCCCLGIENWTDWKKRALRIRNMAPQSSASHPFIRTNIKRRQLWRANCCIPSI